MEIEVKARVEDLSEIKNRLVELGAKFTCSELQEDSYFKFKGREMEDQGPGSFIVRLRKGKEKSFITIKEMTEESGIWNEWETSVSNPEMMRRIIEKMGYIPIFGITKQREKGELDGMELCIDDVKQLGKYLEVAIEAESHEGAKEKIMELMRKLGIEMENIEPRGYARIISENMGIKFKGVR